MTGSDTIFNDALNDILSDLGCEMTYEGATIYGYFKSPSHSINTVTGEIEAGSPGVEVRTCDVPGITKGKQLTIGGTDYTVVAPPFTDGKGTTILELATT